MQRVREPAVAGMFYPREAETLRTVVERMLAEAKPRQLTPKALIAPHAGYVYSGPIAATAYALLRPLASQIRRVVLLGPSHYVPFAGLALPDARSFRTPLGEIELDDEAIAAIEKLPQVCVSAAAHAREHSLEVQLPFLQVLLGEFKLVPLAVGEALPGETAAVLESLWGGSETLVVISSDLSHYRSYQAAVAIDGETAQAIERLDGAPIDGEHACGCHPIRGLLHLARSRGLTVTPLDRRNSGDTAGDRSRVVGYGAWAFCEAA